MTEAPRVYAELDADWIATAVLQRLTRLGAIVHEQDLRDAVANVMDGQEIKVGVVRLTDDWIDRNPDDSPK